MLAKAPGRGADGLILNLEDAVAPANKQLARQAVADALRTLDFGRAEAIVRINPPDTDAGYRDLLAVTPLAPAAILLPKVSSVEEVRFVAWTIERLEELPQPARGTDPNHVHDRVRGGRAECGRDRCLSPAASPR